PRGGARAAWGGPAAPSRSSFAGPDADPRRAATPDAAPRRGSRRAPPSNAVQSRLPSRESTGYGRASPFAWAKADRCLPWRRWRAPPGLLEGGKQAVQLGLAQVGCREIRGRVAGRLRRAAALDQRPQALAEAAGQALHRGVLVDCGAVGPVGVQAAT